MLLRTQTHMHVDTSPDSRRRSVGKAKGTSTAQLHSEGRVADLRAQLRAIELLPALRAVEQQRRSGQTSQSRRGSERSTSSSSATPSSSSSLNCGMGGEADVARGIFNETSTASAAAARAACASSHPPTDKPTISIVRGMRVHHPSHPVSCRYQKDFLTGKLSKRNLYHGHAPGAMAQEAVRTSMRDIDTTPDGAVSRPDHETRSGPDPAAEAAERRAAERAEMEKEVARRGRLDGPQAYAYDVGPYAAALRCAAERDAQGGPLTTANEEARRSRMMEKEHKKMLRMASRAKLQELSDLAKIRYKETATERRERLQRDQKLYDIQFRTQREAAVHRFVRRGKRLIFTNSIAMVAQVLQMLDLYQAVDSDFPSAGAVAGFGTSSNVSMPPPPPAPNVRPRRQEVTSNTFAYTLCGISGSCLTLFSLAIIFGTILSLGTQSQRIPPLAKLSVYLMYLSGSLQMISLYNLLFAIAELVLRCSATLDWAFTDFSGVAIIFGLLAFVEMVLTVFLPGFLLYNILQNKSTVYSDLYYMCHGTYLRNHIFTALSFQLCLAGAILAYVTLDSWLFVMRFTTGLPGGRDVTGRLMLYPFFVGLIIGIMAILNGVWYRITTGLYAKLEDDELALPKRLEEIRDASRVLVAPGKTCRLVALVEKPSLIEKRALILESPNRSGKIKVLADNQYEMLVEEFQLAPDMSPEEREKKQVSEDADDKRCAASPPRACSPHPTMHTLPPPAPHPQWPLAFASGLDRSPRRRDEDSAPLMDAIGQLLREAVRRPRPDHPRSLGDLLPAPPDQRPCRGQRALRLPRVRHLPWHRRSGERQAVPLDARGALRRVVALYGLQSAADVRHLPHPARCRLPHQARLHDVHRLLYSGQSLWRRLAALDRCRRRRPRLPRLRALVRRNEARRQGALGPLHRRLHRIPRHLWSPRHGRLHARPSELALHLHDGCGAMRRRGH